MIRLSKFTAAQASTRAEAAGQSGVQGLSLEPGSPKSPIQNPKLLFATASGLGNALGGVEPLLENLGCARDGEPGERRRGHREGP